MAAPIGNQFWKLRSKHGRDMIFETPEKMWEAACEYFEWCDEHPLEIKDYVGKDGKAVIREKTRAYTLAGLALYFDVNTIYFTRFEEEMSKKTDEKAKDFCKILSRIKQIMYNQKFTGAAADMLNANIIARDLGLIDKTNMSIAVEQPIFELHESNDSDKETTSNKE